MRNSDLTYSEIAYLFAEQFVQKANIFNSCEFISGNRVEQEQLAEMLCLGSLLYLMDKNIINLEIIEIENRKLFWISREKIVIVTKTKNCNQDLYSIEKKLFEDVVYGTSVADVVENSKYGKRVSDIVKNLIPDGYGNPWNVVISIVREDLIQKGYLSVEEHRPLLSFLFDDHYIVNQEKTSGLEEILSQTKYSLSIFKSYRYRDLYKETSDEIRDAIKSKLYVGA